MARENSTNPEKIGDASLYTRDARILQRNEKLRLFLLDAVIGEAKLGRGQGNKNARDSFYLQLKPFLDHFKVAQRGIIGKPGYKQIGAIIVGVSTGKSPKAIQALLAWLCEANQIKAAEIYAHKELHEEGGAISYRASPLVAAYDQTSSISTKRLDSDADSALKDALNGVERDLDKGSSAAGVQGHWRLESGFSFWVFPAAFLFLISGWLVWAWLYPQEGRIVSQSDHVGASEQAISNLSSFDARTQFESLQTLSLSSVTSEQVRSDAFIDYIAASLAIGLPLDCEAFLSALNDYSFVGDQYLGLAFLVPMTGCSFDQEQAPIEVGLLDLPPSPAHTQALDLLDLVKADSDQDLVPVDGIARRSRAIRWPVLRELFLFTVVEKSFNPSLNERQLEQQLNELRLCGSTPDNLFYARCNMLYAENLGHYHLLDGFLEYTDAALSWSINNQFDLLTARILDRRLSYFHSYIEAHPHADPNEISAGPTGTILDSIEHDETRLRAVETKLDPNYEFGRDVLDMMENFGQTEG